MPPGLDPTRAIKQRTGCPGDRDCMTATSSPCLYARAVEAQMHLGERTRTETRLRFAIRCAACTAMALISSVVLASRPAPGCARVPGCTPVDTHERMRAVHHLVSCVQCPIESESAYHTGGGCAGRARRGRARGRRTPLLPSPCHLVGLQLVSNSAAGLFDTLDEFAASAETVRGAHATGSACLAQMAGHLQRQQPL